MIIRTLGLFLVFLWCSFPVFAAQLNNISVANHPDKISVLITIDGSFTHKMFTLSNPGRVVLDLSGTNLAFNLKQPGLTNAVIKGIRSGSPDNKTLRLVFDVTQNVRVLSNTWQSQTGQNGLRIDIMSAATPAEHQRAKTAKIMGITESPKPASAVFIAKNQPPIIHNNAPVSVSRSPSNKYLRDVIVVLDAGHGGKDPGAKGPARSQEKAVVLAITLKLKQLIDRQPGMRAVLTRSGDYYVGLRQRLDIARKYNGDIFVSIHADAFNNPHSSGASVFALSQSGATSEAARWIAEKENYSELGGVNLGELDDTNGVVRSVLIDLSQTATINSSLQMGGRVLRQLDNFTKLHNNKVEQARFMVLKSPDIPSVLIETGFISNPIEERNLTSPAYQARLSQAIFQGLKGYFWENPPHGTRIEAMTTNNFHIVKAGETIPAIAARYHVSVNALLAMNGLSQTSAVKPGSKLVIPSAWA